MNKIEERMNTDSIIKRLSTFSIGPIIGAAINLITTPVITYYISPDEYGKANMFTLALSIIQLVVFLGMDQAYAKRYYESHNKSSLFVNAIAPSFALILLFEIITATNIGWIGELLFSDSQETTCVFCLMLIMPALSLETFLLLSIRMSQRGKLYSGMTILSKTLILIATVGSLVLFEKSFRSVVVGMTIGQILFAVALILAQRKQIQVDPKCIDLIEIKKLLLFGLPLVPTTIIGWILTGMDKIMLRSFGTYFDLGIYGVATKVAAVLTIIQSCFTTFWVPLAYQWNAEGKEHNEFTKVGRTITAVMAISLSGILLIKPVIFLLFSHEYSAGQYIMPFLLFTPIMYTISEVTVMGIYFSEKTIWTVLVSILSASVNLLLNTVLIPVLGGMGAAIATGVSYIVFFWVRTLLSRKLWYAFPINHYIITTCTLVMDALASTFIQSWIVYVINVLCLAILILIYRKELLRVLYLALNVIKPLFKRSRAT